MSTTPAEFLALPVDPDEDAEQVVLPPLERIAQSLQVIAGLSLPEPTPVSEAQSAALMAEIDELKSEHARLTEAFRVLDTAYAERGEQIAGVLAIVKPSVSKLANEVRAFLAPPAEEPAKVEETAEALSTGGAAAEPVALSNADGAGPELVTELPGQPHNHSFYEKSEDGTQLLCSCGYAIPA